MKSTNTALGECTSCRALHDCNFITAFTSLPLQGTGDTQCHHFHYLTAWRQVPAHPAYRITGATPAGRAVRRGACRSMHTTPSLAHPGVYAHAHPMLIRLACAPFPVAIRLPGVSSCDTYPNMTLRKIAIPPSCMREVQPLLFSEMKFGLSQNPHQDFTRPHRKGKNGSRDFSKKIDRHRSAHLQANFACVHKPPCLMG